MRLELAQPAVPRAQPSAPDAAPPPLRAVKLLDQVRERVRMLHYSRRTEEAYVHWCRAYIRFHGLRHPRDMGASQLDAFLAWLVTERKVSASTVLLTVKRASGAP